MFRDALGRLFTPDAVYSCEEDIKRFWNIQVLRKSHEKLFKNL